MRTSEIQERNVRRRRRRARVRRQRLALAVVCLLLLGAVLWLALRDRGAPGEGPAFLRSEQLLQVAPEDALCVVCIDPGHGGSDQGASWEGRLEKEDNLALALALQQALAERNIRGALTRADDTGLTLEERVAYAQEQQADYYISLHRNFAEVEACGVETWVAEQCSDTSLALANAVQEGLAAVGIQNDRGVRRGSQSGEGDYYVLSNTSMPAILIEMGFLQDEEDNRLLDRHLEDYAAAIADAVLAVEGQASAG